MRWKVTIIYAFISTIPLIIFSNRITNSIENHFNKSSINKHIGQANIWAETLSKENYFYDNAKKTKVDVDLSKIKNTNMEENYILMVINNNGIVVNDSNYSEISPFKSEIGNTYFIPEVLVALSGKESARVYRDQKTLYAAAPIETSNDEVLGAILIVASVDNNFETIDSIDRTVLFMTLVFVMSVSALIFISTKVILDSLDKITTVVKRMSEGRREERIEISGKDEFADLATAFNTMAEEIEQSEKTREQFVSNVSHELKTPISSIKILSEAILLQENVPEDMYREFLQDIVSEVDRMNNIVNDLLDVVKLDQGETGMNVADVEINQIIRSAVKRLNPLAIKKDIELSFTDNDKTIVAQVDEMKLNLAFSNLIENAIKYTDNGGKVMVTLKSDHQHFFFNVKDTGVGISTEEQGKIFSRFYRVDETRDRETGGTGLGLSITHNTVLLHEGIIKVDSKQDEGSTFIVTIPLIYTNKT